MALQTYSDLQTAILDWMGRPGDATPVGTRVQDYIALFEARVRKTYRVRQMEVATTLAITGEYTPLPADFLEIRNLYLHGSPSGPLDPIGLDFIREQYDEGTLGQPRYYAVIDSRLQLAPVPDGAYTVGLEYYAFVPLSVAAPTNWLMTAYPDLYLFGSLIESESFVRDTGKVQGWMARYGEAFAGLEQADTRAKFGPGTAMKPSRPTP